MKKIIIIILILFSIGTYSQTNKNDSLRFNKLEKQIKALQDSIQRIKLDDTSLYILKKDIIQNKINYNDVKRDVDEKFENFIVKHIEATLSLLGLIAGFIFWLTGKKISEEKIRKEVEEKISELTNIEKEFITKNLIEYKKHINLKNSSKIIVLNEKGTDFPEGFKKVLALYKGYNESNCKIDIVGIKDALLQPDIIKKLRKADLVIIENQVEKDNDGNDKHWKIYIDREYDTIKEITKQSIDGTQERRQPFQNNLHLIELSNKICDTTAIVYYGQSGKGNFPSNFVDEDKQHMITFANAPSQLYGNILNMLKFKSELNAQQ